MNRIHIVGASGTGTSSLGRGLAATLGIAWLDADDFYWHPSDPPYTIKKAPAERVAGIRRAIEPLSSWVLSGSLVSWGDPLLHLFTLAVFLELDPAVRLARLHARETALYGGRIAPGGDMHALHVNFMEWARQYDIATSGMRCRRVHVDWLAGLSCPVVQLDAARPVSELIATVAALDAVTTSTGAAAPQSMRS